MPPETSQRDAVEKAIDAFVRQTGCKISYVLASPAQPFFADGTATLQAGSKRYQFCLEIKDRATSTEVLLPLLRQTKRPEEFLLVTRQLTPQMADRLRENNIQFIDAAGNAFINRPPLYLFVKGNKITEAEKPRLLGRAFKQTGLRVLYAFLCNPGMENEPYRLIAAKTGVALGMVDWTMRELRELGFVAEMGSGRLRNSRLVNKAKLLERWITAYAEQLRPRLFLGRFSGAERWWDSTSLDPELGLWGGEVAAARMTGYLVPQDVMIYVPNQAPAKLLAQFRLKKDPHGNVEFYSSFWKTDTVAPHRDMVHPLLVYADLVATGDQRNIETAKMIYDQHIAELIRED